MPASPRPGGPAPQRPARALLAWEFGAGRTHAVNLLGVAARLRGARVECLATLYETRFAADFARLGVPTIQTYVWPARRRAPLAWQEREVRGLGDVLANLGVADPDTLRDAIAHYESLFYLFRPDIVLCENAFGAILAARGRVPVIAFGNGACLPPTRGDGFALPTGRSGEPSWPISDVAAGINEGLARTRRPPLATLADVLRIDGVHPYGPAPFDLYAGQRETPVLPPFLPDLKRPAPLSAGEEVFVYLHGFVQGSAAIMDGLCGVGRPMRIYIPGLADEHRRTLSARGIVVETGAVPPDEILTRSRCVVHHGGPQLTTACLAAGIPQVLIAKEPDNELCGRFVQERGLGFARHVGETTADFIVGRVRAAFDDADLKRRCAEAAPEFRQWLESDPSETVAAAALSAMR